MNDIGLNLREACQLTGSLWAVVAERDGDRWFVQHSFGLQKPRMTAFVDFLGSDKASDWLVQVERGEKSSLSVPVGVRLGATRLYAYPIPGFLQMIIAAANRQSTQAQRIWRLTAGLLQTSIPETSTESFLPNLQTELASDLPRALERVLATIVRSASPQGAWLGIRRGEALDISTAYPEPQDMKFSVSLESNSLLRRLNRTNAEVLILKDQDGWADIPNSTIKPNTRNWLCLPLVVGKRLIGAVALWRHSEFTPFERRHLQELVGQASPAVEIIVTFSELTNHLRRIALLNDFALSISSAQNLDQISRRVFGSLARVFGTERISLYIPSVDGRILREFSNKEGKFNSRNTAFAGHYINAFLKDGQLQRFAGSPASGSEAETQNIKSALVVPLKYRGQMIGAISLESARPDAFAQYDEHLMVVIASHLAGLIEYGRLREEAEARARSLGLIHEVVQQVVGLNEEKEVAQITADMLAQYFAYELAGVILADGESAPMISGFGGSRSDVVRRAIKEEQFIVSDGITGRVFGSGEGMLVNNTDEEKLYKPLLGWDAGSEMCVAIRDGSRVLGIIDVESSERNAFTYNDMLALESLAGVLATVISSAHQYQRLQDTVHQLRSAQVELRARMAAQQDAESRLIQAAKLAAVGEMAAGIAHELNNPLTTLSGFAELVFEDTPVDALHKADMGLILQEARRARSVVRRLLDFARQGERSRAKSDLNEIVTDVLALSRHLIQNNGVNLQVDLQTDLPWVSVDSNQMKQVFLNLIHNALQAMPRGGALEIRTSEKQKDDRPWAVVSIADSGVGIEPAAIGRIFEPFFTTRSADGGTGLGLSVSYGIVADHGGSIDVESRPGSGTTFVVWLPL